MKNNHRKFQPPNKTTVSKTTHTPKQPINVDFSTHLHKLVSISRQGSLVTVHRKATDLINPLTYKSLL